MTNNLTWKEAQNDTRFIKLSEGNKKLSPNKETRFLVWSILAEETCPYATEDCKKACYGKKAYRAYGGENSNAWASDFVHEVMSKQDAFIHRMIWVIHQYMNRPSYAKAEKVIFRIHERGDFYSPEYMRKWYAIANEIKAVYGNKIEFIAYTKSVPFVLEMPEILNVINVRFSMWADTLPEYIDMARSLAMPIYTATDDIAAWDGAKCRCDDCAACAMCWNMKIEKIACEIH